MHEELWDLDITLLAATDFIEDDIGNQIPILKQEEVYGYEQPISRSEFYTAGQSGITVTKSLVIHPYDYEEQTSLILEGIVYDIIRVYPLDRDQLELTCQRKLVQSKAVHQDGNQRDSTGE